MKKILITCIALSSIVFSTQAQQAPDNTLTAAEKKQGWKLLFDGKTIRGWRTYQNKPSDGWKVIDGQIVGQKEGVNKRADLITADKYENFELSIDWKVDKGANSGIVYRANEAHGASYESGPEYQLIDDLGYPDKLEDWQKSGSNYAMHPPTKISARPAGEYNTTIIKVNKAHVEHWLNGDKVVEYDFWTPEWEKLKTEGKWKDKKDYGMVKSGIIALQDHGGGISFKNVKIRKL